MIRIKIVSDGTRRGTSVVNAETGEPVHNVISVKWELDGNKPPGWAIALIEVVEVPIDLSGDLAYAEIGPTRS